MDAEIMGNWMCSCNSDPNESFKTAVELNSLIALSKSLCWPKLGLLNGSSDFLKAKCFISFSTASVSVPVANRDFQLLLSALHNESPNALATLAQVYRVSMLQK